MALTARERTLIVSGGLIAAAVAVYTLIHAPLSAKQAEASEALAAAQTELHREQAKLKGSGDVALRKTQVAAREMMIDAQVPGKHAAGMFVYQLAKAEQASGARIRGIRLMERLDLTPSAEGETAPVPLTVVRLGLEVEGMFSSQLLFNQALEDVPLFLNTDKIGLKRPVPPTADALKVAQAGYFWEAVQALGLSPSLAGTYTVNVYFRGDKVGPDVGGVRFSSEPGRPDPYALDGVEAYLRELLLYYPALPSEETPGGPVKPKVPQLG